MCLSVFVSRCQRESEDKDCRLRELERRLQKQQQEHEELVERNEELEALLGEAQNKAKEERECHECEMDSLQRKVRNHSAERMPYSLTNSIKFIFSLIFTESENEDCLCRLKI